MSKRDASFEEFDPDIFEKAKKSPHKEEPMYSTAALPDLGIDMDNLPDQDLEEIRRNKAAFLLFVHKVKDRDENYQNAMQAASDAKHRIAELERTENDRKSAVIIMTIAEVVTSVGVGGLFTEYAGMSWIVLVAGIMMTALSLYLNFKK